MSEQEKIIEELKSERKKISRIKYKLNGDVPDSLNIDFLISAGVEDADIEV